MRPVVADGEKNAPKKLPVQLMRRPFEVREKFEQILVFVDHGQDLFDRNLWPKRDLFLDDVLLEEEVLLLAHELAQEEYRALLVWRQVNLG